MMEEICLLINNDYLINYIHYLTNIIIQATFWTNPQYKIEVSDADVDTSDGKGTIILGVMQKERRRMKKEGIDLLTIGYAVYKVIIH